MRRFLLPMLFLAACGGSSTVDGGTDAGSDATADAGSDAGTDAGSDAGTDAGGDAGSDAGGDAGPGCAGDPTDDADGDGFAEADGDCDDCDATVNPGAYDFVDLASDGTPLPDAMQRNQACDGLPPMLPGHVPTCDGSLALDDADPLHAAQALGLCAMTTASARTPGLLDARFVGADGSPSAASTQVGIQSSFGTNVMPREGASLLALSTGRARTPGQPSACPDANCSGSGAATAPPGFPVDTPGCATSTAINDDAALEVQLRVPTNANGIAFDFSFYAHDFPTGVCTGFTDQFVALLSPPPAGSLFGDVAFDALGNPVTLNSPFAVCDPSSSGSYASLCTSGCPPLPSPYCPDGTSQLVGTGFDAVPAGGATGWLQSTTPVTPGSTVTLRFAIWDLGDARGDSTVLLDAVRWIAM